MQRTTLTIGGRDYLLAQGVNVDELTQTATNAIKDGGGVLLFAAAGDRSVSIIISPGVPVTLETLEVETAEPSADDLTFPFGIDLSEYER
jgi:hypothetical protein